MRNELLELARESVRRIDRFELRSPRQDAIRLDLNEAPDFLDDDVKRELAAHLATLELNRYPDGSGLRLRTLLSEQLGLPVGCVALGNGSEELIWRLAATFAEPRAGAKSGHVLYSVPTFPAYRIAALASGMEPVEVPLTDRLAIDWQAMAEAIESKKPNLIFLCRPDTPTGRACPRAEVDHLLHLAKDSLVVIDEAYAAFGADSCVDLVAKHDHVVILRTLSKMGLASLRIGYAAAGESLIPWIERARPFFPVGGLNQAAAEWLLERHADRLRHGCEQVRAERERVRAALAAIPGVVPYPSVTNFQLVWVPDGARVWAALAQRGVLVGRPARFGDLEHCIRVAVGLPVENDRFLAELEEIVLERDRCLRA